MGVALLTDPHRVTVAREACGCIQPWASSDALPCTGTRRRIHLPSPRPPPLNPSVGRHDAVLTALCTEATRDTEGRPRTPHTVPCEPCGSRTPHTVPCEPCGSRTPHTIPCEPCGSWTPHTVPCEPCGSWTPHNIPCEPCGGTAPGPLTLSRVNPVEGRPRTPHTVPCEPCGGKALNPSHCPV